MTLEEWFFPHANRISKEFGKEEWGGRVPILVEDCWHFKQQEIDVLNMRLQYLINERELIVELVKLIKKER